MFHFNLSFLAFRFFGFNLCILNCLWYERNYNLILDIIISNIFNLFKYNFIPWNFTYFLLSTRFWEFFASMVIIKSKLPYLLAFYIYSKIKACEENNWRSLPKAATFNYLTDWQQAPPFLNGGAYFLFTRLSPYDY